MLFLLVFLKVFPTDFYRAQLQTAAFETEKERRNDTKDAIKPRLHLFLY